MRSPGLHCALGTEASTSGTAKVTNANIRNTLLRSCGSFANCDMADLPPEALENGTMRPTAGNDQEALPCAYCFHPTAFEGQEGRISQDGTTGPDSLGVGYATDREDL